MEKELTPLEALRDFLGTRGWYDEEFKKKYDFVVNALKEKEQDQEKLKALKIIIEKRVDVCRFVASFDLNDYNFTNVYTYQDLTQEEYDLLKEIICK